MPTASKLRQLLLNPDPLLFIPKNSNLPPSSSVSELPPVYGSYRAHFRHPVSWAAIFAGLIAALALRVLFMMLGAGLGFAIYRPLTDANPIADLGKGAVIIEGMSAVFSL